MGCSGGQARVSPTEIQTRADRLRFLHLWFDRAKFRQGGNDALLSVFLRGRYPVCATVLESLAPPEENVHRFHDRCAIGRQIGNYLPALVSLNGASQIVRHV